MSGTRVAKEDGGMAHEMARPRNGKHRPTTGCHQPTHLKTKTIYTKTGKKHSTGKRNQKTTHSKYKDNSAGRCARGPEPEEEEAVGGKSATDSRVSFGGCSACVFVRAWREGSACVSGEGVSGDEVGGTSPNKKTTFQKLHGTSIKC